MDILISSKAEKQFDALPKNAQVTIRKALSDLKNAGLTANLDIKKLRGYPNHYRIRIRDYRIRIWYFPDIFSNMN